MMKDLEQLKICLQEQVSDDEYKRSLKNEVVSDFYNWVFENEDDGNEVVAKKHLERLEPLSQEFPLIVSFAKMFIG